jgi:hypothetical protein
MAENKEQCPTYRNIQSYVSVSKSTAKDKEQTDEYVISSNSNKADLLADWVDA